MRVTYCLAVLLLVTGSIFGQTNLLGDPTGSGSSKNWKIFRSPNFEINHGQELIVRKAEHIVQIIKLDAAAGKFAVILASASMDKVSGENLLSGYPALSGYLLSTYAPHGSNKISAYMSDRSTLSARPKSAYERVLVYGIFEVPADTVAAQITLDRASRNGEEEVEGSVRFDYVGFYLFDTREAAQQFVSSSHEHFNEQSSKSVDH